MAARFKRGHRKRGQSTFRDEKLNVPFSDSARAGILKGMKPRTTLLACALGVVATAAAFAAEPAAPTDLDLLAKALEKTVAVIQGKVPSFTATLTVRYKDGETEQGGEVTLVRLDGEQFALAVKAEPFAFLLLRTRDATTLVVPVQKLAVVGKGPMPADSDLAPARLFARVAGAWPSSLTLIGAMQAAEPGAVALILQALLGMERVADKTPITFTAKREVGDGKLSFELAADGRSLRQIVWRHSSGRETALGIAIREEAALPTLPVTAEFKTLSPPRDELERALGRGLGRAAEILSQDQAGAKVRDEVRTADRGRLVVQKGSRVAMLQGSALEIGYQHGKLLAKETRRVADSVLYVAGLYYTVTKREWFLDVLRGALKRLEPHVPQEYLDEMQGLANGSEVPLEEVRLASVFPELFHCSGFALFGKATAGGRLLHGRVLDYMTELGLQRDAVVFVVKKKDAIPFANVGYAGFIGSVSGLNAEQVAFGEMGGKGDGLWDGTPMALLMRMGLERAKTLDDAVKLFREAKRTCEYYYVISDGKGPSAVGLKATPEAIELLKPGQPHPLLPAAFDDAVLMSAGTRLQELVKGVKAKYGQFDELAAIELMRRPVAMRSNLHDVLFVPQELVFYVANARGRSPACDQPYVRHSLRELLDEMSKPLPPAGDKPERKKKRGSG